MTEPISSAAVRQSSPAEKAGIRGSGLFIGAFGAGLLFVALVLPNDLARLSPAAILAVPLELAALVALLSLVPRRLLALTRIVAAIVIALAVILKLADMAAFEALARPFNPILDLHLLDAAWNLLTGAVGVVSAGAVVAGAAVAVALVVVLSGFAVGAVSRIVRPRRRAMFAVALPLLLAGFLLPPETGVDRLFSKRTFALLEAHGTTLLASLSDLEDFQRAAAADPARLIPDEALLSALDGRDVMLLFVESYGRTVIDNPEYSRSVLPVLERFEATLEGEGLRATSGYLTSPIVGGQSWLAHASVLSGLRVDGQRRYNSLVISERSTLVEDFQQAGYRSVAVMPAITMAWPEGAFFGYDAVYDVDALDYRGLPFNWVTMPDQYTLFAFDRLERLRQPRQPLFAEIALISSHAPWTPIPEIVDWNSVGDGSIFNDQARSGDTPEEVWSDPARVRIQYRRSIEYALSTLSSYIKERHDGEAVLVILGDHQPARIITGETTSREVPFHVISGDPAIIERIETTFGTHAGMVPRDDASTTAMQDFRELFLNALSGPGGEGSSTVNVERPEQNPI